MSNYTSFLDGKRQVGGEWGFEPVYMPDCMFDFQKFLTEWALRKGMSAFFADCGLGKTIMQLVWAENVKRHTNKPVLILAPLSVCGQTVREGEKFGIEVIRSTDGKFPAGAHNVTTNYERLHHFNPADFSGVVGDESSILKNFNGVHKAAITEFARMIKYRLFATATAAPNDYIELGTHSEALGDLGYMDMLSKFFVNDQNSNHPNRKWAGGGKFRFRGHAQRDFWRWVVSWSRALRKPSDVGFSDDAFKLPELITREHVVHSEKKDPDMLFALPAINLQEQRAERRRTIEERCEKVVEIVEGNEDSFICWTHLNDEGDLLEKLIPGSVQVSGRDPEEHKEEMFLAFERGDVRVMITKPKVAGFGLNWQHCHRQTFFPSHSFEQYYQCVRRSWRFGQSKNVEVDIISSTGEAGVVKNLQRKADQAGEMFGQLVALMNNELKIQKDKQYTKKEELPTWLS